jgi:hypothetical protein
MQICLKEEPDRELLLKVARHKEVYDHDRDRLEAFARMIGDDGIKITYKQNKTSDDKGFGRLYPRPYRLNATYQWGRIRSTLYGEKETDIDIVNCQPSMLLGYCRKLSEQGKMDEDDYGSLTEWVEKRDEIVDAFYISEEAIELYNKKNQDNKTKKDLVKNLVVITSFGGTKAQWAKSFDLENEDYKVARWYKIFETESIYIAKTVVENHPKRDIAVKMYQEKQLANKPQKKKDKPPAYDEIEINYKKVLALILQDKEAEIVVKAIKTLQKKGIEVTCYIYDGFQVKNTELLTDEVLDEIGCPEFNCRFIRKPFAPPLPMGEENLHEEPPDYFRPSIFNAINNAREGTPTHAATLQEQKRYFEQYFAMIDGKTVIMEKNGDDIFYHKPTSLKMRFGNLIYYKETPMGVAKDAFYNWWNEQEDRLSYKSDEMRPPPLKSADNVLNMWEGWPIEEVELDESADYSPIIDLFDIVTGRDEKAREYLLKWFALKVQRPGAKTMVSPVFYSAQEGTGKTTIAEDIFSAFLMEKSTKLMMSTDTVDRIVGKFNNAGEKLICILNEANLADIVGKTNPLKSFITDKKANKEIKGLMNVSIDNICDLIFTTNNANAVKISQHDRRYVVFEADASVANNSKVFAPIIAAVRDEKVMRAFFEYLKNIDIRGFKASEMRPMTAIYKEMRALSLSTIQNFFIDYYDKISEDETIRSKKLWEQYTYYCEVQGKSSNKLPLQKFLAQVKREVRGVTGGVVKRIEGKQSRCTSIDYDVLGEWVSKYRGDVPDDEKMDDSDSEEECDDI